MVLEDFGIHGVDAEAFRDGARGAQLGFRDALRVEHFVALAEHEELLLVGKGVAQRRHRGSHLQVLRDVAAELLHEPLGVLRVKRAEVVLDVGDLRFRGRAVGVGDEGEDLEDARKEPVLAPRGAGPLGISGRHRPDARARQRGGHGGSWKAPRPEASGPRGQSCQTSNGAAQPATPLSSNAAGVGGGEAPTALVGRKVYGVGGSVTRPAARRGRRRGTRGASRPFRGFRRPCSRGGRFCL